MSVGTIPSSTPTTMLTCYPGYAYQFTSMLLVVLLFQCIFLYINAIALQTLSYNWVNREPSNDLTRIIKDHQSGNCSSKVYYHSQKNHGMGSDVHIWTQAVCNAMQVGATLVQLDENWIWNDRELCQNSSYTQPLGCYFGMQKHCPHSGTYHPKLIDWRNDFKNCPKYIQDVPSRQNFRAAAMEYLFATLNPRLVQEANQVLSEVFGTAGIPKELITVHIRWGDKSVEMKLVHQHDYVTAIEGLVQKHNLQHPHIFVTTESIDGLDKLREEMVSHNLTWPLHFYAPAVFNSQSSTSTSTSQTQLVVSPMDMAKHSDGSLGRASLVSLLLAMEARYYVLTTGSNWSRLIDALRKNVVNPFCGNCTDMVDLREGFPTAQNWRKI